MNNTSISESDGGIEKHLFPSLFGSLSIILFKKKEIENKASCSATG